jgi:hypothetical protein
MQKSQTHRAAEFCSGCLLGFRADQGFDLGTWMLAEDAEQVLLDSRALSRYAWTRSQPVCALVAAIFVRPSGRAPTKPRVSAIQTSGMGSLESSKHCLFLLPSWMQQRPTDVARAIVVSESSASRDRASRGTEAACARP